MVTVHVGGKVLSWAEAEPFFANAARNGPVEFRDNNGSLLATSEPEPLIPWDASITQADIDRAREGPFVTFDEMKEILGWE